MSVACPRHFQSPWQCENVKKVQVLVYVCAPLLGCAYEGGNREEARMVGLLHVPRTLQEWETGKSLGQLRACWFSGSRGKEIAVLPKIHHGSC